MTKNNLRDAIDRMGEAAVDRFLHKEDTLKEKSHYTEAIISRLQTKIQFFLGGRLWRLK